MVAHRSNAQRKEGRKEGKRRKEVKIRKEVKGRKGKEVKEERKEEWK